MLNHTYLERELIAEIDYALCSQASGDLLQRYLEQNIGLAEALHQWLLVQMTKQAAD